MTSAKVILGIDPGFDRVGWAIATPTDQAINVLAMGCVTSPKSESLFKRYQYLTSHLSKIITKYQPTVCAIETLFFSNNVSSAIKVSEARGVIIATIQQNDIPVFDYNPTQIKLAVTGDGNADKLAMEKMIRLQINLADTKHLDDVIDAVGICLTHRLIAHNPI